MNTWDYQPEEWAERTLRFPLWSPAAFYLAFFVAGWLVSLTGTTNRSTGRYSPPQPMDLPFWELFALFIGIVTLVMWLRRPGVQQPGRLVLGEDCLWLLDAEGLPEKVWDAQLPIQRSSLLLGINVGDRGLEAQFLVPGPLGTPYTDLLRYPAAAQTELVQGVKEWNERLGNTHKERAAQVAADPYPVLARPMGDDTFAHIRLKPAGMPRGWGCLLTGLVGLLAWTNLLWWLKEVSHAEGSPLGPGVFSILLLLAFFQLLMQYLRGSGDQTVFVRLGKDCLWVTPGRVRLGLPSSAFYAQNGKVLSNPGEVVLRNLEAPVAVAIAAALSQILAERAEKLSTPSSARGPG